MSEPARSAGVLTALTGLVLLGALLPPLAGEARRSVWAEALQFSLLAFPMPALLTLSAPWRHSPRLAAIARRGRPGRTMHGIPEAALFATAVIAWRVPPAVDGIARHGALPLAEAATFALAGVPLWRQLVASPPFVPSLSRPERMVVAAVAMWISWIVAYLLGFSHVSWFLAYRHVAGKGLSLVADQSLATGVMWAAAAVVFAPVVFASLIGWLKHDEDPDVELQRLLRVEERRRRIDGLG